MWTFYADEHVQSGIVEGLRRRGIDVLTVQEDFREGAPDPEVVDRATELGRVVLTADADYLVEGVRRQARASSSQALSITTFRPQDRTMYR